MSFVRHGDCPSVLFCRIINLCFYKSIYAGGHINLKTITGNGKIVLKDYSDEECMHEEIISERILVKNGHFAGALILTVYDYYNGGGSVIYGEKVLLLDTMGKECARCGSNFTNDDHERWDYTDYYLVNRDD